MRFPRFAFSFSLILMLIDGAIANQDDLDQLSRQGGSGIELVAPFTGASDAKRLVLKKLVFYGWDVRPTGGSSFPSAETRTLSTAIFDISDFNTIFDQIGNSPIDAIAVSLLGNPNAKVGQTKYSFGSSMFEKTSSSNLTLYEDVLARVQEIGKTIRARDASGLTTPQRLIPRIFLSRMSLPCKNVMPNRQELDGFGDTSSQLIEGKYWAWTCMYLDLNLQNPVALNTSVPNPRDEFMKQLETALSAAKIMGTDMILLDPEMYQDYDSGWVDNIAEGYVTKFQEELKKCGDDFSRTYCQYLKYEFVIASDTTHVDGNRVKDWVIRRLYEVGKEMAKIVHRVLPKARIITTFTGFDKNLIFDRKNVFIGFSHNYAPAIIFEGMLQEAQTDPKYIFELIDGSERPVDYPHFSAPDIRSKLYLQERYIKPITDLYGTKNLKLGAPIALWHNFRTDVLKCPTNEIIERNCSGWTDRFNKERLKYLRINGAKVTYNKIEDVRDILCELFSRREYVWIYGPKRMKYHELDGESAKEFRNVIRDVRENFMHICVL